jgi:hypothetical protein
MGFDITVQGQFVTHSVLDFFYFLTITWGFFFFSNTYVTALKKKNLLKMP